ncbi:MAG: TonB-dependent receptor [Phaeodactylibacter sp.]|nr:TonB-dependent receptor [Phaeodactylibacter sp.]MCB9272463.1 TonB-dependent receptor [Lewinellaceae bacterium]
MKQQLIIFLFSVLSGLGLMAQEGAKITGTVLGEGGEPLVGAVVLSEDSAGTVTDGRGQFGLMLPAGEHRLIISYLGYDNKTVVADSRQPSLGSIELPLSSTSLEEIIVSASAQNYKQGFKGANYRISPIAIQNINPLSTEEALRAVPGVNIVGDMGLSNRPNISIRGSWGRRSKKVLLMEDGTPSAPAPYVAPGAYYNPVSDRLTAIEVYKGADMLRFGPNNMYGAVNYITALPPQKPELRLKLVGGQRNYATGLLSYGGTWNNLGALVEGVYKKFDGFTDNSSVEVLNLNAKIFAKLADNQSLYFKVSGQFEDNQASLSSITPFTFEHSPTANPFDADQFTMRRYGVDIIHKWLPKANISLTSKIYASDFERDWWRQVTAKVKASDVRSYVGESIFKERYGYMEGLSFGEDDYVRVGRIANGRESTTDSRWIFTVSGLQETFKLDWNAWGETHELEAGLKLHQETYKDRLLVADSSRWARSGAPSTDLRYYLWSVSGYVRQAFHVGKMGITPIVRIEHIDMYRQNLLALSKDPNLDGVAYGREPNRYNVLLPGLTLDYRIPHGEVFGSIYEGFIAPSKVFGFLVERDGVVTNPLAGESINIKPELSINTEIGWRGSFLDGRVDGQAACFSNTVRNFYAGGENEVFQELGKINIQGVEAAIMVEIFTNKDVSLRAFANASLLRSKVLSGSVLDRDLFGQTVHSTASRQEFINRVNANRGAYQLYVTDAAGAETLLTAETLTEADFARLSKSIVRLGEGGIADAEAPYSPGANWAAGLDVDYRNVSLGVSGHYVGQQYTEFNNFRSESADGSIGELDAFFTVDAYANYEFSIGGKGQMRIFVNGKNLGNDIFRASRLNRATSGIFPGGFRQLIAGLNLSF